MRALLLVALPLLGACSPGPSQPPLRSATTPEEHLWLRCVRLDPAFLSDECRRFRSKER